MIQLSNNCRVGKMSVYPNNWDSSQADPGQKWYISYYFYDDNLKASKKIIIKGMNKFSSLKEKQNAVEKILKDEKESLEAGFNPITKYLPPILFEQGSIDQNTPFEQALNYAFEKAAIESNTKSVVKTSLKIFLGGATRLNLHKLPLKEINKRHVFNILENCGEHRKFLEKKAWNARYYNSVRSDIGILYRVFKKMQICEYNVPQELDTQKVVKKIRRTTSALQRSEIIKFLDEKGYYTFKRFMMIFFYSGARIIELIKVKYEDVDFEDLRFIITVKKGRAGHREEYRVINKKVLHYWQEIYNEAKPGDYLFFEDLRPGPRPIRSEQINKRWKRHMKDKLGVKADFYSLKHTYLDQLDEIEYDLKLAQTAAGHTSERTTEIYTTGRKRRKNDFLTNAKVSFA